MMRPSKEQRQFRSLAGKWKSRMWLESWYVDFNYVMNEEESADASGGYVWQTTASIHADPRYRKATVSINRDAVKDMTEQQMNRAACHEMVHAVISPMQHLIEELIDSMPASRRPMARLWQRREQEGVCEHIASMMLAAFKEKQ